jgi:hypothetical protein
LERVAELGVLPDVDGGGLIGGEVVFSNAVDLLNNDFIVFKMVVFLGWFLTLKLVLYDVCVGAYALGNMLLQYLSNLPKRSDAKNS